MSKFARPVTTYMTSDPTAVAADAPISQVVHLLSTGRFSAVPVLDGGGAPLGVVSRTDLLQLGLLQAGRRHDSPSLPMPHRTAGEVMTAGARTVGPEQSLAIAAATMAEHHIHRLFIVDGGRLVGVLSTSDLAAAVRDAGVDAPISAWMTAPVVTIEADLPLGAADELLATSHVSAVVVLDHGGPVGVFAQQDALACRHLARDTAVGTVADPAMICLPTTASLFRAASYVVTDGVRRIIACEDHGAVGVLGGLDFARVVAAR